MKPESITDFIRSLPKTEIHLHVEAVMGPDTYNCLRKTHRTALSGEVPELYSELSRRGPLDDMVRRFLALQSLLRAPEDFAMLAADLKSYAAANNIGHLEVFVSPSQALRGGYLDFADIMDPLTEAFDPATRRPADPDVRFIVDVSRSFGPENAARNLDLTLDYLSRRHTDRIAGIGLGGRESGNPARDYRRTFERAGEAGLHRVAHAGEDSGPESIREAILILGAERIGHGTSAILDSGLMSLMKDSGITLEICPTSNLYTGAFIHRCEDHPLRTFFDAGLRVSVNTDDPALFGVGLNDELIGAATCLDFDRGEIVRLLENSIRGSFMDETLKPRALDSLALAAAL